MKLEFSAEIWFWRGPSPYHFVTVPDEECGELEAIARQVTYGWGMIPATVEIGGTTWKTALYPKDGRYVVPLKDRVRDAERLDLGDRVTIRLLIGA